MMFFVQGQFVAHQAMVPFYEDLPSGSFHDACRRKRARAVRQNSYRFSSVRKSPKKLVNFLQAKSRPIGTNKLPIKPVRFDAV